MRKKYSVSFQFADYETGGTVEFLKRLHIIEQRYKSITIVNEKRHAEICYKAYTELSGDIRTSRVPGTEFSKVDESEPLGEYFAGKFRSILGGVFHKLNIDLDGDDIADDPGETERGYTLLESFSDSDWQGTMGCKSTSGASHFCQWEQVVHQFTYTEGDQFI